MRLAPLCNIGRSYIARIERGKVIVTVEKLYNIAYTLEKKMLELYYLN